MFGSVILGKFIRDTLLDLPIVQDSIGEEIDWSRRIVASSVTSKLVGYPAILFYNENSTYGGPVNQRNRGGAVNYEGLRMVIKLQCKGESIAPIYDLAMAQFDKFDGIEGEMILDERKFSVVFSGVGEVPMTTLVTDNDFYRQLGTIYEVDLYKI